jgi:hypothetical protein
MAERLKNILAFANLAPGASVVLPHDLNTGSTGPRPIAPDIVFVPSPDLAVTASDALNITLMNQGAAPISGAVLVEAWHTIERAFNGVQNVDLPVKPYVVVSVENNNQPAWPPFPSNLPPKIIYANATGSDTTGDGSQAKPFRTFQRGVQALPNPPLPGQRVILDITGLGSETLPANYALPSLQTCFGIEVTWSSPFVASYFPFMTMCGVDILARPKLATLAQGLNVLGLANITSVDVDPDTNLLAVTTNQNYGAADSLKGKLVQDGIGLRGIIWHNTAGANSVLYLTIAFAQDQFIAPLFVSNPTGFPPGNPPGFPLPFGPTLQIVEQSAEFLTQKNPGDVLSGGFMVASCGGIGIRGVKIRRAVPGPGFNTEVWGGRSILFEGCQLDGFLQAHSSGQSVLIHTLVHDGVLGTEAPLGMFASMCQNVLFDVPWLVPTSLTALGFVMDGCTALGTRNNPFQPVGRGPTFDLQLRNGVIMGSVDDLNFSQMAGSENFPAPFVPNSLNPALATPGHGILMRGGHAFLDHVKIFGCTGDAIHAEAGGGFIEIKSITGGLGGAVFTDLTDTANGGAGLLLTDGTYCRVSDKDPSGVAAPATNVTGAAGDANVGDTPIVTTWAAVQGGAQTFDIVGATASGSRLFAKPL